MSKDEQSGSRRPATTSPDDKPQSLRALAEMARRQKTERASAPPSLPRASAGPPSLPPPSSAPSSALRTPVPVVSNTPVSEPAPASERQDAEPGVFVPPTRPPATAPKERRGVLIGALIAMAGIGGAAAYAFEARTYAERSKTEAAIEDDASPDDSAGAEAVGASAEDGASVAKPQPHEGGGIDLDALPDRDEGRGDAVEVGVASAGAAAAGAADAKPDVTDDAAAAPVTPDKSASPSGTLAESIADAVGSDPNAPAPVEAEAPAGPAANNAKIPKHPPQGAVQAGVRPARSAAKACVAGADAPSQANLTFGSSGAVQSVSVGGWAAENGQSACIKSAFAGASVGPFQDPSYTIGVTIRP